MKKLIFFLVLGSTFAFGQAWFGGKSIVSSANPTNHYIPVVQGSTTGSVVRLIAPQDFLATTQPAHPGLTNVAKTLQGFLVRSATTNTYVARQIVAGNPAVTVTDGSGNSGDPTISLDTPLLGLDTSILNSSGTSNQVALSNGRGGVKTDAGFSWDPDAQTLDVQGLATMQTIQAWNLNPRIDSGSLGQSSKYWPSGYVTNLTANVLKVTGIASGAIATNFTQKGTSQVDSLLVSKNVQLSVANATSNVIDFEIGIQDFVLTNNTTFSFANNAAGKGVVVNLIQNGTGGWTAAFPASLYFINASNQVGSIGVDTRPNKVTTFAIRQSATLTNALVAGADSTNLLAFAGLTGTPGQVYTWTASGPSLSNSTVLASNVVRSALTWAGPTNGITISGDAPLIYNAATSCSITNVSFAATGQILHGGLRIFNTNASAGITITYTAASRQIGTVTTNSVSLAAGKEYVLSTEGLQGTFTNYATVIQP